MKKYIFFAIILSLVFSCKVKEKKPKAKIEPEVEEQLATVDEMKQFMNAARKMGFVDMDSFMIDFTLIAPNRETADTVKVRLVTKNVADKKLKETFLEGPWEITGTSKNVLMDSISVAKWYNKILNVAKQNECTIDSWGNSIR